MCFIVVNHPIYVAISSKFIREDVGTLMPFCPAQ